MADSVDIPKSLRHELVGCYDAAVSSWGGNLTGFLDAHYATWYLRSGGLRLECEGQTLHVEPGQWVFCTPDLRRSQSFHPDTHIVSIRTLVDWGGRHTFAPPAVPIAVPAQTLPELLPAGERLIAQRQALAASTGADLLPARCRADAAFHHWLALWYESLHSLQRGPAADAGHDLDRRVQRILVALRALQTREPIPYHSLTAATGLGRTQIDRLCLRATGHTPRAWADHFLLEKSQRLFLGEAHSVKQVADRLGFVDTSHFAKWFRRHAAVSPKTFQRHGWE